MHCIFRAALCALVLSGAPSFALARDAVAAQPVPWQAEATVRIDVEERRFTSGGVRLGGTLHAPRGGRDLAAVVVFHGASDPLRDAALYRHLTQMLPALGIAVFVCDRRGSGRSAGTLPDGDYTLLADDGIAAQRMLARDPRIDPRRIGFWGLSQGGWLALLAASRAPETGFAISVSAPLVAPDAQMLFAVGNILRIRGYQQSEIDLAIRSRRIVDAYYRGETDRTHAQAALDIALARPRRPNISRS